MIMEHLYGYSEQIFLGDKSFSVYFGEKSFIDLKKNIINVSPILLHECGNDIRCASSWIYIMNSVSQIAKDKAQIWMLALSEILTKPKVYKKFIKTLQDYTDPIHNNAFVQMFFLSQLTGTSGLDPRITNILDQDINTEKMDNFRLRSMREKLIEESGINNIQEALGILLQELRKYPLQSGGSSSRLLPLSLLSELARSQGLLQLCHEISSKNRTIKHEVQKQIEKKDSEKKEREFQETNAKSFQEEYSPQDSIMESSPESPVQIIGMRSPPIGGYFKEKVGIEFNSRLQRETHIHTKKLIAPTQLEATHVYECILPSDGSSICLPLPHGLIPVERSPDISISQAEYGVFLVSGSPGAHIRVGCTSGQKEYNHIIYDIDGDESNYVIPLCSSVPPGVQDIIHNNIGNIANQLSQIATCIRQKIYSTKYQGTYKEMSNSSNEYIGLLRDAPKMECYSANHLMVALARYIGIPARLSMGYRTNFTHKGKTAISSNDGHARAELYINGQWQRRDVTPLIPDSDDEQELGTQSINDDTQENIPQEGPPVLDESIQDPLDELEEMAEYPILEEDIIEILQDNDEDPDISAQRREGISLEQAKDTYDRLQKNKHRSGLFARKLKDWLQEIVTTTSYIQVNTKRPTGDLDIQRVMKNQKLLTQYPDEIVKLANSELPIWKKKSEQNNETISLPDELRLHLYIDVSGSMNNHQNGVKDDIVMIRDSLRQLAGLTKKLGMKVTTKVYAFADREALFLGDDESIHKINMTDKSISRLSHLLTMIPDKFQRIAGTGNDENAFYKNIVNKRYEERIKEKKSKKRIKHIGLSFTDQETLTDGPSFFDSTKIAGKTFPEQNNQKRLEGYLHLLKELELPVIAINCEGRAQGDSGYHSYIAGGKTQFTTMPEALFKEISKLLPIKKAKR